MTSIRVAVAALFLAIAFGSRAEAQSWDRSGNNLLQGTYNFRNVVWLVGEDSGALGDAAALYGNIVFDGNGNYTLSNARVINPSSGTPEPYDVTGTYAISASGYGWIEHPLFYNRVYGLVSNGIFVGSATEYDDNGYLENDIFIAAAAASAAPTNASFKGPYAMAALNFPGPDAQDTVSSLFRFTADGNGGIGSIDANGYIGSNATLIKQTITGATYSVANGTATVNFGAGGTNNTLINESRDLYFSADGSFVFGGSATGYDIIVGVSSPTTAPAFSGLYYQAGVIRDVTSISTGFSDLQTLYGSFKAGSGVTLNHERLTSVFSNGPIDYSYTDTFLFGSDGSYEDAVNHYVFGLGGNIRIGSGNTPYLGLNVAIKAPTFAPTGVFIDPTGVVNAASSAMFTAGLAPGEFITIYGANLASTTAVDPSFPTTLAGVQVKVNGRSAPIYVVSQNQISAVLPFATAQEDVAAIQVINNNTASNTVTSWVNLTAPGVFTDPSGGIGRAAALHPDYSVVTAANPAKVGETIALFVTGLGEVDPPVADAAPGPVSPLSKATNNITVLIDNKPGTVVFAGLAPQLVGLNQINVTVPTGIHSGNVYVDIGAADYYSSQATIPIAAGPGTTDAAKSKAAAAARPHLAKPVRTAAPAKRRQDGDPLAPHALKYGNHLQR